MDGRPERVQTDLRLVRRAQPRATRSQAIPPTVMIIVFVAVLIALANEPRSASIGAWDPPVVSVADAPSHRSTDPSLKATSSAPRAISVALLATSSLIPTPPPLPECRYADEPAANSVYQDWQRTIVDTASRLPKGYEPPDLVPVSRAGLSGGGSIRRIAIADLKALVKVGRKAGVRLAVESAYRSEARQQRTFAGWVRKSGEAEARRFSARPGHSEHQLGTAIDFKAAGGGSPWTPAFARSRQGRWLVANAWRFGWIQSYPQASETQTCYGAEAWHYRYVGRVVAARVHESGMTLRAWLWAADLEWK